MQGKRAPFVVPAAVLLAIGAGAAAPIASGAPAPPSLAPLGAEQLVAHVLSAQPPQLSGELTWTANLGLGDLATAANDLGAGGGSGGSFNPLSLLDGTYQVDVWLDGSKAEHLSMSPQAGEEVDFVRNGNQAWTWDSSTMKVQHYTWSRSPRHKSLAGPAALSAPMPQTPQQPVTPQQLAQRILAGVSKTTTVTVPGTKWVGGIATYELVLTPGSSAQAAQAVPGTTIDHVEIDVAGRGPLSGVPLQVAVYAKGQATPALDLGFGPGIHVGAPAPGELGFTPPPGSTVVNHSLGAAKGRRRGRLVPPGQHRWSRTGAASMTSGAPTSVGSGWDMVWTGTTSALTDPHYQQALDATTTVVTVDGEQGRLFSSTLANVLILPGGRYYAGLVTPAFLEATATSEVAAIREGPA